MVCIGMAPAFQRTLIFDRFHPGEVNRARETRLTAGGKAVNTALALARLGRTAVVAGFNGGGTGRQVAALLRAAGVTGAFTSTPWPTRTCTTVVDLAGGGVTELVEEARTPTPELRRRFERRAVACLSRASLVVCCGALPPGVPDDCWARLAAAARARGVPVIIDSHSAPLRAALAHAPLLAKVNARELERTFGIACRTEGAIACAAQRLTQAGAVWALVTRGAKPAILVNGEGTVWRFTPPKTRAVRSPIGSGDCLNAGVADAWLSGADMPAAVRLGMACGSAKAATFAPAEFDPARARVLAGRCRMTILRSR